MRNSKKTNQALLKLLRELKAMTPAQLQQLMDHQETTDLNDYDRKGFIGSFGHDIGELHDPGHYDRTTELYYIGSYSRHGNGD